MGLKLTLVFLIPLFLFGLAPAYAGIIVFPPDTPLISFKNHPTFFLTLDKTGSFVGGKQATTHEVKLGLDFKKKLKLGVGYAWLASDVVDSFKVEGLSSEVSAELSLRFFSVNGEYVFYNSKKWQIAMPVSMGIGSSYFGYYHKIRENEYERRKLNQGGVVLINGTGMATYRLLRWIGISGGLGYRLVLVSNKKVKESFNSPVYVIKIRVFMGEIYKTVFPRGVTGKRNPPYSNEYWD